MTIQLDAPTATPGSHISTTPSSQNEPLFFSGWSAALGYYQQKAEPVAHETAATDHIENDIEVNIFAPQVGIGNKIRAYRGRRRLNRTYRRNQRQFEAVLDNVAHDPASQRELQTSWILGH